MSQWYALNPDIRQLRVYAEDETDPADARDIYVSVALIPVCDSDDVNPIWMARSIGWERDLQRLIGRKVHLECFDADTHMVPCAEDPQQTRICLASVAWRDTLVEDIAATRAELAGHGKPT